MGVAIIHPVPNLQLFFSMSKNRGTVTNNSAVGWCWLVPFVFLFLCERAGPPRQKPNLGSLSDQHADQNQWWAKQADVGVGSSRQPSCLT